MGSPGDSSLESGRGAGRGPYRMRETTEVNRPIPRDPGEGLVLRQATAEDTEAAAEFQAQVHARPDESGEPFRVWTRDLMTGALPGFGPGDFTLV